MKKRLPASIAIASMWAAVAVVGARRGDIVVESRKGDRVSVPIVGGVALFAMLATLFVAIAFRKF